MRVGLNLLYLIPGIVGGTQTYAASLLEGLLSIDSANDYVVFVNHEARNLELASAPNLTVVPCRVRATNRPARYAYEQLALPVQTWRQRLDVLHSLGYVGPLVLPCPHVVTVHDLIYVGFKDHMPAHRQRALAFFVRGAARRADRVITMSEYSRRQILDAIEMDPSKVEVIPEAGRPMHSRVSGPESDAVLAGYGIEGPYVAAFGSLSTSKNIGRLVEAFAAATVGTRTRLVLIGHLAEGEGLARDISRVGIGDRVVITGYVPDDHLVPLIGHARVFAFPSLYEGFGLPVLDAQTLGVPVACSDVASLPEVAGGGALLFDPYSVQDMASALRRCLTDPQLRRHLIEAGIANVERFSWVKAARGTLAVYNAVARKGQP